MPFATYTTRCRRYLATVVRSRGVRTRQPGAATMRRWRIHVPERALLGAAMSGALRIAERRLNRMQASRRY
ncbi:MAG TPA: hypothetical protein VIC60_08975 [Thermomicrobiales bacterium]|jgi:hypothetical protein